TGTADVVTAKRVISTNVMVGDSEFLVLGGLIDESFSGDDSKVPMLGSIPVLGHLFKSRSRSSNQSVLMVFIRATILDNRPRMSAATRGQYQCLRPRQLTLRVNYGGAAVSPPLPERIAAVTQPAPPRP